MGKTVLDLKSNAKPSELEGAYIMSVNSPYTTSELKDRMINVVEEQQYAVLRFLSFVSDFKVGDEKQYISQIIDLNKVPELGESMIIAAPTGSGKTKAIIKIINNADIPVVYLTNRLPTLWQFKKDFIKSTTNIDVSMEMIDIVSMGKDITALTYQKFAEIAYQYKEKKCMIILDEVHCLLEDATFSVYPEKFIRYLKSNLDNTSRIYLTATPDAVSPSIACVECISGTEQALQTITWDTEVKSVFYGYAYYTTRVKMVYSVKSNWDYIDFKLYSPDDTKELTDYIKTANENGIKSLIYINDINKGKALQENLGNTQHIYSDDDKRKDIAEIAKNEKFADKNLITTKVTENGISLIDDELNLIVVETLDLITLQQVIGRARVNRKKPRKITVLIPDYSYTDIGNAIASISQQLKKANEAAENPDNALEYTAEYPALIYYDSKIKKPVVNSMAIKSLEYQLSFLRALRVDKESPHAFAQKVLEAYDKSTVITDDMFLSYDRITDFKSKVSSAFDEYMNSEKNAESLDKLKSALKDACNSTRIYNDGKTISSNIQLSTVNDILKSAGIGFEIKPKIEIYSVSAV
ncbi:MAG: DEAD/DEAH box helicase family protein [Ruminococcus flavefaciens]|nr:DEAD/DEAH box helicase family protein [Ruminococcus flavefaciens]